jgi:histidinol-phosphate aminotransferase
MAFSLTHLIRPHLANLLPYSSARDDFKGTASVYLDANENPFDTGLNRYPDPHQHKLKQRLAELKNLRVENLFIGNGSDEPIDLLMRAFCEPGQDNVLLVPPTYGMYKVSARINNIVLQEAPLTPDFDLDVPLILSKVNQQTKLLFLCSPNNPTGNLVSLDKIEQLLQCFAGLVVVDEAYIDFTAQPSLANRLIEYPNMVVLQTLSKAWGLAAARIGLCWASKDIIDLLDKIKPPYNVSGPSQVEALQTLENIAAFKSHVIAIQEGRAWLQEKLPQLACVKKVFPTDANFILARVTDAQAVYDFLAARGIIVRNRSKEYGCDNCLRITVGTSQENQKLIETLKNYGA